MLQFNILPFHLEELPLAFLVQLGARCVGGLTLPPRGDLAGTGPSHLCAGLNWGRCCGSSCSSHPSQCIFSCFCSSPWDWSSQPDWGTPIIKFSSMFVKLVFLWDRKAGTSYLPSGWVSPLSTIIFNSSSQSYSPNPMRKKGILPVGFLMGPSLCWHPVSDLQNI